MTLVPQWEVVMASKWIKVASILLCLGAVSMDAWPLSALAGGFTGTVTAFVVVPGDDGKESFMPADRARPGDVIEYRLLYENRGSEAVTGVSIVDPIPFGVVCMPATATSPPDCSVEFSIDHGKSYHAWPIKVRVISKEGEREWKEATPDMITHVRWVFSSSFKPKEKIKLAYRAEIRK